MTIEGTTIRFEASESDDFAFGERRELAVRNHTHGCVSVTIIIRLLSFNRIFTASISSGGYVITIL